MWDDKETKYECHKTRNLLVLRDWSLITGRGGEGLQNGRGGGHVKFYPYEMGRGVSHAEGGHKKFRGSFYAVA